jgi:hypothetical protein
MTVPHIEPGEVEREHWKKIINDHKECISTTFVSAFR